MVKINEKNFIFCFTSPAMDQAAIRYNNLADFKGSAKLFKKKAHEVCDINKDTLFMDFGCGTGLVGLEFLDDVSKVIFLDPSLPLLSGAKYELKERGKSNYEIVEGVITDYKGPNVDVIAASLVLHHCEEALPMHESLKGLYENLKPNGKLLILEIHERNWGPCLPVGICTSLLKDAGFENIKVDEFEPFMMMNASTKEYQSVPRYFVTCNKPLK